MRRYVRSFLLAGACLGSGAVVAGAGEVAASADNSIVSSTPEDGAVLTTSPNEIVTTFAEPVGDGSFASVVCDGAPYAGIGEAAVREDQMTVTLALTQPMSGECSVAWTLVGPDGAESGRVDISFTVDAGTSPASGPGSGSAPIDLEPARAGLAAYLQDNRPATPSTLNDSPGCPAIDLDRFQGAIDAAGFTGELADWGSEIEWGDYEALDPDLMGIVCSGDADGNANDRDFGLYASVRVIDARTEDQAQEVLQALGYGALEGATGDVPGGELFATCLDEEGVGALCLAFWSFDGFVVGTTVVSSEQDVPAGSSTDVLETVLPEVLATLSGYVSSGAPAGSTAPAESVPAQSPPESGAEGGVEAARAGLRARLAGMGEIDELEPLGDCPVAERDAVVDALEIAGVDTPIESLLAEQGPTLGDGTTWRAVGLVCTGSYVGAEDDESFPELRIDVVVADFRDTGGFLDFLAAVHPNLDVGDELAIPALGTGTIGECASVDRTEQCAEYWEQDGFVVGVQIADRVFIDRPTASAVLGALVPSIVEMLAAEPEVAEAADVTVPSDDLTAARERLDELTSAGDMGDCPLVDQASVHAALEDAGIDLTVDQWSSVASETGGIACAGSAGQGEVQIDVVDYGDSQWAQPMIDAFHGCESISDTDYCAEWWEQDGLAVAVSVTAVGVDVSQPQVRALADSLAPAVVGNLAAHAT